MLMNLKLFVDANSRTFQNTFLENSLRLFDCLALFNSLENREYLWGFQGINKAHRATIKFLKNYFDEFNYNLIFIIASLFCFFIFYKPGFQSLHSVLFDMRKKEKELLESFDIL